MLGTRGFGGCGHVVGSSFRRDEIGGDGRVGESARLAPHQARRAVVLSWTSE